MKDADRARDLLAVRREHSKGQGNLPDPEPAPRANPPGGMELAKREISDSAASRGDGRPRRAAPRPNTRRSSAAKREATRGERPRSQGRQEPGQAAKNTEKNAKRRAGEARGAKREASIPRRAASPAKRASGLMAPPRRTAKTQPTSQGGKKASSRTSAGKGRSGRR